MTKPIIEVPASDLETIVGGQAQPQPTPDSVGQIRNEPSPNASGSAVRLHPLPGVIPGSTQQPADGVKPGHFTRKPPGAR
jgi:hypothetical protein